MIYVLAAGTCWGVIGLFSHSLAAAGFSALEIAALRCMVAGLAALAALLIKDRSLLKVRLRDLWMFAGTGILSFAMFNVLYFLCMQKSTLAVSCTLLYTGPCFVAALACLLFKERFTGRKACAIVLCMLGCAFMTGLIGEGGRYSAAAIAIGIGSGFCYALYSIFGRVALAKYHEYTVVTYTFVFATLALLPFCRMKAAAEIITQGGGIAVNILLLGLACTLLPFLLYTKGLQKLETGKAAILAFAEPLVATVLGTTILKEPFGIAQALGIAAVLAAIMLLAKADSTGIEKQANPVSA